MLPHFSSEQALQGELKNKGVCLDAQSTCWLLDAAEGLSTALSHGTPGASVPALPQAVQMMLCVPEGPHNKPRAQRHVSLNI